MKTILIDDEKNSLQSLAYEINLYCTEVEIIGQYSDPIEGLKAIEQMKPELVMLDVEMPKMNGFQLLRSLDKIFFDVIFITAYDEYAVNAFEFNAIDYLLKPILKSKLIGAIKKVKDKKDKNFDHKYLQSLLKNLSFQKPEPIKNIALPTSYGYEFVSVDDILYVEAEGNYTKIFLSDTRMVLLSKTLKLVESVLPSPQFFRVHQSYIVNTHQIRKYYRGKGGYLVMPNEVKIPVSRTKRDELIKIISTW